MQAAELISQLLDFRFSDVLLVLRFDQLFGDIFEIAQHTFQDFAEALYFSAHISQDRSAGLAGLLPAFAKSFLPLVAVVRRLPTAASLLVAAMVGAGELRPMLAPTAIPVLVAPIAL